jgi:hypothetical protein
LRRIRFIKKCLKATNNNEEGYLKTCWFICNKYSLTKFSKFFDGDLRLAMRVKLATFSFLRKFRLQVKTYKQRQKKLSNIKGGGKQKGKGKGKRRIRTIRNVNGLLVEPVQPSLLITHKKFVLQRKIRPQTLGEKSRFGFPDYTDEEIQAINETLKGMNYGSLETIRRKFYEESQIQEQNYYSSLNSTFPGQVLAHRNSPFNNLVNKLFKIAVEANLKDHMFPKRKLKARIDRVLKQSKIDPLSVKNNKKTSIFLSDTKKNEERHLQQ